MQQFLKSGNLRLYLYLGVLISMGLLWRAGEAVTGRLAELPVHEAPKVGGNTVALNVKNFSAVFVKQAVAVAGNAVADESQIDSLFKREDTKTAEKSIERDYGQLFIQSVRIDGVSDNGLIINGRFYSIGSKLETLAMMTTGGKQLVPRLDSLKNDKAIFDVGTQKVAIATGKM